MSEPGPVRVLHVIDSFDLGGGQTALWNLLHELDRAKFAPEVACLHGPGVFGKEFAALRIPVHVLSPKKWLPLYVPRLVKLITTRRPGIIHCHLFWSNWIAKPIAAALGVPVRINHDQCNDRVRYDSPAACWLDTLTNRLSSHICAVSNSTRGFLIEHEGIAPDRISLVYNGVDLERFQPPGGARREGAPVVLGVGRLHPQKNFSLWLEVAALLTRAGIHAEFQLAGTGPEETMLRQKAEALQIADRVKFLGHISDTPSLFSRATVLLMTSRFEGTPLAILEAMAMRLPIVAPRLDGIGEILENECDALLVDPPRAEGFATAVTAILKESALAAKLASAAERKVRARFSASAMARTVEAIYERCLEDRANPAAS
jgi:glycosyltransferase involved in cell wall biosynthesis